MKALRILVLFLFSFNLAFFHQVSFESFAFCSETLVSAPVSPYLSTFVEYYPQTTDARWDPSAHSNNDFFYFCLNLCGQLNIFGFWAPHVMSDSIVA